MDYDKLIERLKCPHIHRCPMYDEYPSCKACQKSIQQEAAIAIETLRADLARVTAERDALIKRTAGDCWSCIRRYECNSRKGPHSRCWEFDPRLLKED